MKSYDFLFSLHTSVHFFIQIEPNSFIPMASPQSLASSLLYKYRKVFVTLLLTFPVQRCSFIENTGSTKSTHSPHLGSQLLRV